MKLAASWTHGFTCLFWLGSTILTVLTFLGNYSGTPALRTLHLFSIDKNNDNHLVHDRYTIGIFGTCSYTKNGQQYNLEGCNSNRAPYYFDLQDILVSSQDVDEFQGFRDYQSTFQGCMKAAWALLIVFLGINGIGLLLALTGMKWSSFCREAAVQLGIVNLCVILATAILVTVSVKHAVSKFNGDHSSDVVAAAHFGGGGIAMVWVLFAFCYLCFAFITVLVKRRNVEVNAEMQHQNMNFDINSDVNTVEDGLSTPQVKATDGFNQNYSPSSTLKGTPQSRTRNKLPMPSPVITRPFTPENSKHYQSPQSPASPYSQTHSYYGDYQQQQRKVSNNSIYTRATTPLHQPYATAPYASQSSPSSSRVSSNGARQPKVPAQYQHTRVARLNDTHRR